ncbi:CotH kinase family protein [uncultured Draconibacterium sp.]|uniref:CotH kinase family protein n=1 Tax=uncultured Draconibacterium sp. TaxID=1573823 RepID=UPI0026015DC3|nr:CotH kinase family protein [uncultured Draconibacterium sp.]
MRFLKFIVALFIPFYSVAQDFQSEYHYSEDSSRLIRGGLPASGLYDLSEIKTAELIFEQDDYWSQLKDNYYTETPIVATLKYDGKLVGEIGVRFRGNTSYRSNATSQKKSFKLDIDFVDDELRLGGYKNLRFNNAHADPAFMKELLYGKLASAYGPIAKVNYIRLFINGVDWGLYLNAQHHDKTYLEEWFLSNDGAFFRGDEPDENKSVSWEGTSALNYLGADTLAYQTYYTLKSSDIDSSWQYLVKACEVLNNATAENCSITGQYFNIDQICWFLAVENIFTDEDSYIQKGKMDYLIYIDAETGLLQAMEYDGNETFQTDHAFHPAWKPFKNVDNENYPLLNKLLVIPKYRQRYLAHYRTILSETLTSENVNPLIDSLDLKIRDLVANDNKKLYTTEEYFEAVDDLKIFVDRRHSYMVYNSEVQQKAPVIDTVMLVNSENIPLAGNPVSVIASLGEGVEESELNLYYSSGMVGRFNQAPMFDDGEHDDGLAGDGVYGGEIPGMPGGVMVRYYVEAVAANSARTVSYYPAKAENDVFVYNVMHQVGENGVVINELMASNSETATDEEGKYEDWAELYNNNDFDVNLGGYFLTDDATRLDKWQFAENIIIEAKGYLIVWTDDEEEDGPLHTSFKLSAAGETLILSDNDLNIVDQVDFGEQSSDISFARYPNGTGDFRTQTPTFNETNGELTGLVDNIKLNKKSFLVYPNPVNETLYLRSLNQAELNTVEIYNSIGEKMVMATGDNAIINVKDWPSGLYVAICGGQRQKFIKK